MTHSDDCYLVSHEYEGECTCGYAKVIADEAKEIERSIENEESGESDAEEGSDSGTGDVDRDQRDAIEEEIEDAASRIKTIGTMSDLLSAIDAAGMKRPLLSLVMIVKDEAASIRAVLQFVKPIIDRYTILDTGSTDATIQIIRETMVGIPGAIFEEPFIDFATSRNRALNMDRNECPIPPGYDGASHFQFMLSGDEYLRDGAALRTYLEAQTGTDPDCHTIRLTIDERTFFTPRIFRASSAWRYEGAIHEYPINSNDRNAPVGVVPDAYIDHIVADKERRITNVWERDIPLLEKMLNENPEDYRALAYLAECYFCFLEDFETSWEKTHYAMNVMSLYLRCMESATATPDDLQLVRRNYLAAARHTKVYSKAELLSRAEALVEAYPRCAESAALHAQIAITTTPLGKVYELARHAAKVAEEMAGVFSLGAQSTAVAWRSHHLAAVASMQLAEKYPDRDVGGGMTFSKLSIAHARAGIAAGGPPLMFQAVFAAAGLPGGSGGGLDGLGGLPNLQVG